MISKESLSKLKEWLGEDGINFFNKMKTEHGRLDAIFMEGGIPHPVHLREGMQVRNFLRGLDECKDWDAHKLDNKWVKIVKKVL